MISTPRSPMTLTQGGGFLIMVILLCCFLFLEFILFELASSPFLTTTLRPDIIPAQYTTKLFSPSIEILSSRDFLVSAPPGSVILFYPFTEYGLLCNNLHQISSAIDLVLSYPHQGTTLALAFDKKMGALVERALDVHYLQRAFHLAPDLRFPELNPNFSLHNRIHLLLDFDIRLVSNNNNTRGIQVMELHPKKFQQKYGDQFSFALTFFLQPNSGLRSQAEAFLSLVFPPIIVSVHRRSFAWCSREYKKYSPFCGMGKASGWKQFRYYEDDCNVTLTPQLKTMLTSLPGLASHNFSFFLASDLHDRKGDDTFLPYWSIAHQENEEHYIAEEIIAQRKQGLKVKGFLKDIVLATTGLDMNWDLSMLVDLWAQTLSSYALGQPWSSCDRILAMWRSRYSRAVFQAISELDDKNNNAIVMEQVGRNLLNFTQAHPRLTTLPFDCYEKFESPTQTQATHTLEGMRAWWNNFGLPALVQTGPSSGQQVFTFSSESTGIIPVGKVWST